jgi:hypothetical protein
MGFISTVIFSTFGSALFATGAILIQCAGQTLLIISVRQSRKQDHSSRIMESFPLQIYCQTDVLNLEMLKAQLMVDAVILSATLTEAVRYFDDDSDNLPSKIMHYNFLHLLSKYFRSFNRQIEKLLRSFPSPPETPDERGN